MKRTSLLAAIAGGVVLLSSCKQDETAQGFTDPSREVTFSAYAKKCAQTRSIETTSSSIRDFNVFGVWSGNRLLENLSPAVVSRSGTSEPWRYGPPGQRWPETGTIDFYAYSPNGAAGLKPKYSSADYRDMSIDYTVPAIGSQQDLLVAVNPGVDCTAPQTVSLYFQHLLSRIQLKARFLDQGSECNVYGVAFLHLNTSGTLALNADDIPNTGGFDYPNRSPLVLWTAPGDPTDYVFDFTASPVSVGNAYTYIIADVPADNTKNALLALPQETEPGKYIPVKSHKFTDLSADFTGLDALTSITDPDDGRFYVKIVFASAANIAENTVQVRYFAVKEPAGNEPLTFEAGRSYTFTVDLSSSEYIDFAGVEVGMFDNVSYTETADPTPASDPDPAVNENYQPKPHKGFAGSNIYWDNDNQRLTFDDVVENYEDAPNRAKQGLYFKWGSLIGISPAKPESWGNDVTVYVPDADGNYASITVNAAVTACQIAGNAWKDIIPAVADRDFEAQPINGVDDYRLSGFLTFLNADPANIAAYHGDICAYLSGRPGIPKGFWRMPTNAEFLENDNYTREGKFPAVEKFPDVDHGAYEAEGHCILAYKVGGDDKTVSFPVSGHRNPTNGALRSVTQNGYVWSSSPRDVTQQSFLFFFAGLSIETASSFLREQGNPVRCVKK
jgi:hypothetical protein